MKELVIIEWVDAYDYGNSWIHKDDVNEPYSCQCKSVGWVFKESAENIMLCPNFSNLQDEDLLKLTGVFVIPKCCITKRTTVGELACGKTVDHVVFSQTWLDNRTCAEAMSEIEGGQNI